MSGQVYALIRHGNYHQPKGVPSALLPYALNDEGVQQAQACAAPLKDFAMTQGLIIDPEIHCSKQQRAWQTATLIAEQLGDEFTVAQFAALAERSVGAAANLTVTQIEQILDQDPRFDPAPAGWKSNSEYCLPLQGAESLLQAGERVAKHILSLDAEVPDKEKPGLKLIVGHGASIRHACAYLNILDLDRVKSISMYHASPVYISNHQGNWRVVGGNWKQRTGTADGDEIRES